MKYKAITFSYDDGVEQDKRLIEILERYGLRATFNLNSGLFDKRTSHSGRVFGFDAVFNNHRIPGDEICEVYKNHEIASHSLTHPILPALSDEEVIFQMSEDAKALEGITGKKIHGFAYPGGVGEYCNQRVADVIENNTSLYYGRTVKSTRSFELPKSLMLLDPTISHREISVREGLAREFLSLEADTPKLFYVWGHSYELDVDESVWTDFERFCELISGRDDIFYGTNDEVFRHFGLNNLTEE
ncbi:MAG: polysaccharide deacetylase family protein [Clostridia bacterium]|nr:polysaccharide deacetylase family protein [Clostridia bacterium]